MQEGYKTNKVARLGQGRAMQLTFKSLVLERKRRGYGTNPQIAQVLRGNHIVQCE